MNLVSVPHTIAISRKSLLSYHEIIDFHIFIGYISFRRTIIFQKERKPMTHPILTEDATLSFKDVHASNDLPRILEHAKALANIADVPVFVYVACTGANRKGEIVSFKSSPKELADLKTRPTKRREFYNVRISGHPVLIRPRNGVFDTVTVSFVKID
jgi:hypothetical protein